jgi:hypothetical protein
MINAIFLGLTVISNLILNTPVEPDRKLLATRQISLEQRQPDRWVNGIFKDNILLSMAYIKGEVKSKEDIDWDKVRKPFTYELVLKPGETFAFHDDLLPQYKDKVVKDGNSEFNSMYGYKSSGWLVGDGVCHLASIINWPAKEAGLDVLAPTYHDFARINEVPRDFGVSIYTYPGESYSDKLQNLYITNSFENDVVFVFDFNGDILKVSVFEIVNPED